MAFRQEGATSSDVGDFWLRALGCKTLGCPVMEETALLASCWASEWCGSSGASKSNIGQYSSRKNHSTTPAAVCIVSCSSTCPVLQATRPIKAKPG